MNLRLVLASPSSTLAISLATFCFGILLGGVVPPSWWEWLLAFCALSFALAFLARDRAVRFVLALVAIFLFAIFRVTQTDFGASVVTVADSPGVAMRVSGIVEAEVERRASTQRIILDHVTFADGPVAGRLLVWAPLYPEIAYGDELVFNCRAQKPEPFEGFAYDKHLKSYGILAVCMRPEYIDVHPREAFSLAASILTIKTKLIGHLQEAMSEPHASFIAGLLFGGSSSLSSDLKDDFAATGTAHILAASGFNVSLFSMTFLSWILSTRIGRRRGLVLASLFILIYVVAAGATPAVVRAGIMGGLFVIQKWISRKGYLLNALLLTSSIMLFANPLLLGEVGFQLSFAATAAILTFTDKVGKRFEFIPKRFGLRQSFAGSLAAIVITTPILLWHFGQISVVAPLANLFVLPFVPYVMFLAIIGMAFTLVSVTVGSFALIPAWALSYLMLTIISLFGAIPFSLLEIAYAQILAVASAVLIAYCLYRFYASR